MAPIVAGLAVVAVLSDISFSSIHSMRSSGAGQDTGGLELRSALLGMRCAYIGMKVVAKIIPAMHTW
jgi:hypothetical protein